MVCMWLLTDKDVDRCVLLLLLLLCVLQEPSESSEAAASEREKDVIEQPVQEGERVTAEACDLSALRL